MAATAETDEGTLLFILFLTPEGNVKKYRIHSTESVYNPPGTNRPRELWNWGIIKSMGVEAALTEAERFSSADYNNDQHPDLILASLQMGDTWMLFLDDKGNITGNMYYGAGIQREGSGVAVVDANDDSVPDVVLSKDFPVDQGTIKVLLMDAIRITVTSASFSEEEDEEEEEEGEDSQTRTLLATFQVELSARPRFAIQVDFQVETSDNISDEDVVLLSPSPLNFEADQTSTVVQVSVVLPVEDVINRRQQQEPTITLVLTSAKNALVSSSSNSFLLSLVNSEESSNNDDEDSSDEETNVIVPIVVTIVVVLLVLLAGVGFGVWWRRRKMQIQKRMRVDSQYGVMEGGNRPKRDDDEEEDEDEGFEMKGENLWNIAYHKLTFVEKIGEGAFGEVWKGMWRNSEVAIKKLHTMDDDQLQDFQTEAQTLKGLRPHGNVIQLLGVVNEPDKPFCIVTEFMDKGDLNSYLLQHKDSIDADTMLKWAIDIASGMHHLHSEGITHRDLATRNLLLTKALRLKVADFGMSRKMDKKGGAQKTTNDVGPLKWMAPEAIEDHIYSEKSDVWSFGVCLWEISSFGAVPFEGLSAVNAAVKVCQQREALEPPENSPPVLREVMLTCWAFSPEDRPTFGAILQTLKEKATNALMPAEAQSIQWGNYLVKEELRLLPTIPVGASICSLDFDPPASGFRLGVEASTELYDVVFYANGTTGDSGSYRDENTPFLGPVVAPLTDLNGDERLEIGFTGEDVWSETSSFRKRVHIGSHIREGVINTSSLKTFAIDQPPLSHFPVFRQRYDVNAPSFGAFSFGLSVTFVGDIDKNGVGDIAVSAEHREYRTASTIHILFFDEMLDVANVSTITLIPDENITAFASASELGFTFSVFGQSLSGIGDLDGDNTPDLATTAFTDEENLAVVFILFLTPEGNVKDYRFFTPEDVYTPPGASDFLWQQATIKSAGNEAALTEAERYSSADYNNDHHPDIVLADARIGDMWMLFLDDKGNLTGNMYYGTGVQFDGSGLAIVDANEDSLPDVVLSNGVDDIGVIKVLLMDAIRITVTSASFSEEEDEEEEEEGEDSQTRTLLATFQVELSARPRFAIQVDFQVETSDNISDEDVVLLSPSPLNFEVGQTSTVVQVSVVLPVEESEGMKSRKQQDPTITLHLANAMNALVNTVIVGVGFGVWWRRRKTRIENEMEVDSQYGAIEGGMHSERHEESEEQMESGDIWNIAYTELTFVEKIGEGAFGEVWKGMWRNSEVAIKKLHTIEEEQLQDFQTEAQTLKGLRPHGNVIRLLGVVNKPLCIVTEFMDRGDLNTYLLQHKDDIDADTMLKWAIDIASGMRHLHSEGITHRDLATRNLLLTNALRLKVADFGMSRKLDTKGGAQKTTNEVGPLKWMAPEAIEDHLYSEKSDVWSFGVCLWEIASFGAIPFEGLTAVNAAMRVCQQREVLEPAENAPPVLREVMLSCWAFSPEERPTFADILKALKEEATLP
ncbi:Tyrosine-protein kinase abl1 [Balamuthia mandrillaris]